MAAIQQRDIVRILRERHADLRGMIEGGGLSRQLTHTLETRMDEIHVAVGMLHDKMDDWYCEYCGKPFKVERPSQWYCCERCTELSWNAKKCSIKRGITVLPIVGVEGE